MTRFNINRRLSWIICLLFLAVVGGLLIAPFLFHPGTTDWRNQKKQLNVDYSNYWHRTLSLSPLLYGGYYKVLNGNIYAKNSSSLDYEVLDDEVLDDEVLDNEILWNNGVNYDDDYLIQHQKQQPQLDDGRNDLVSSSTSILDVLLSIGKGVEIKNSDDHLHVHNHQRQQQQRRKFRDTPPSNPTTMLRGRESPVSSYIPEKRKLKTKSHMKTVGGYYSNTTLPDVLMTGVQKSGSTAVADWLFGGYKNNRKRMCYGTLFEGEPSWRRKEPHYFDYYEYYNDDAIDDNDEAKYLTYIARFNDCVESNHMSMDATPNYFQEAEKVYSTYEKLGEENHVKIIVTLREPVAREFSWYNHNLFKLDASNEFSFDDFMERDTFVSIAEGENFGMYAYHLQSWIKYFDRQNILILSYQEICNDPGMVQWRIQQFLGLNDEELPLTGHFKKANTMKSPLKKPLPYCTEAYYDLVNLYEPLNEELYQFLELYPGPEMEQNPFPYFSTIGCIPIDENEEEEEEEEE